MQDRTLTQDDMELLALTRVHPKDRRLESALQKAKWFDYRRHHPVGLTYDFLDAYIEAVREIHAETKDLEEAQSIEILKGEQDIFRRPDLLMFWKARQIGDAIGCTYRFLCRFAMKRAAARGWGYYPRPNQLTSEDLVLDARDAWRAHITVQYEHAKDPFYRIESDVGHPDQLAYRTWLIERVMERQQPAYTLARAFRMRDLEPRLVIGRIPDEITQRATELWREFQSENGPR